MEQIDITQINEIIINSNFDRYNINQSSNITPQINELEVKAPPINICSRNDAHYIMNKFINPENVNRSIYDDELNAVYNFMLGENIPSDLKEKLSIYLTEEMKEHILNEYLTKILPKTKLLSSYEDCDDYGHKIINMKYVPNHNCIPLRYYFKNEYNLIIHKNIEMEYTRILEAVKNNYTGLKIEELYSLKHFFKDIDFFNDKWLPSSTLNIKRNLNSQEWIEAEEKLCDENDRLIIEKVNNSSKRTDKGINDNLSNEIINSIPPEFPQLEKTIYVYSKLCKLLSYDSAYFITEDKSFDILNIDGIDKVDENNNSIICHHFAYMLSNILRKIGVQNIEENISINQLNGRMQFTGHSNIKYCLDGNVIFADSTKSVIGGDLTNHKFQNNLNGIRCELYDESKQSEFQEAKTKVEKYIEYENLNNKTKLPKKDECDNLSLKEKYIVFNNYLCEIDLHGIELISYANSLIQILDLNINTKIMYKSDNLEDILLGVEIDSYLEDGSTQKISYLVDTTTKQIYNGIDSTISFKESLTNKKR